MVFFTPVVHPKTGRGAGFRLCLERGRDGLQGTKSGPALA